MVSICSKWGLIGSIAGVSVIGCIADPAAQDSSERSDEISTDVVTAHARTVAVHDAKNFCLLLPHRNESVADGENDATAYCTRAQKDAPGAKLIPSGGLKSVHVETSSHRWVQVTGRLTPSILGLSKTDEGGQYDNHGAGAPHGATCAGWPHFVELVEPNESRYCIRCCESASDCPAGRSTAGCPDIIPGNYN
jgi:hypothetical protein